MQTPGHQDVVAAAWMQLCRTSSQKLRKMHRCGMSLQDLAVDWTSGTAVMAGWDAQLITWNLEKKAQIQAHECILAETVSVVKTATHVCIGVAVTSQANLAAYDLWPLISKCSRPNLNSGFRFGVEVREKEYSVADSSARRHPELQRT